MFLIVDITSSLAPVIAPAGSLKDGESVWLSAPLYFFTRGGFSPLRYWRVQIPGTSQSFALIYSIEDPGFNTRGSPLSLPSFSSSVQRPGVAVQVMGIDDGYICHHSTDISCFWADRNDLSLGAGIRAGPGPRYPPRSRITPMGGIRPGHILPSDTFFEVVDKGFQASYTKNTGSIISNEAGTTGAPLSTVNSCSWDFEVSLIMIVS